MEEIDKILKWIDGDISPDWWWETSDWVEFWKRKKEEIKELFRKHLLKEEPWIRYDKHWDIIWLKEEPVDGDFLCHEESYKAGICDKIPVECKHDYRETTDWNLCRKCRKIKDDKTSETSISNWDGSEKIKLDEMGRKSIEEDRKMWKK